VRGVLRSERYGQDVPRQETSSVHSGVVFNWKPNNVFFNHLETPTVGVNRLERLIIYTNI